MTISGPKHIGADNTTGALPQSCLANQTIHMTTPDTQMQAHTAVMTYQGKLEPL